MFLKVLLLAAVALAQADAKEFEMREIDRIYPLGLGPYQCFSGIPTVDGCVLKEPNGKYLVIGPLYPTKRFVVLDRVYPTGFGVCKFGIPTVDGCALQDKDGSWVILSPVRPAH